MAKGTKMSKNVKTSTRGGSESAGIRTKASRTKNTRGGLHSAVSRTRKEAKNAYFVDILGSAKRAKKPTNKK